MTHSTPAVEPVFYANTTARVNIQLPVAEENFSRTTSGIQCKRNGYELPCVLPPSASAGGEAADHASFALGSHALPAWFVRVGLTRRVYTKTCRRTTFTASTRQAVQNGVPASVAPPPVSRHKVELLAQFVH